VLLKQQIEGFIMQEYDFLIVGAGLYGAVFAHQARLAGRRCLVIDRRPHLGGNVYQEEVEGIHVHTYGAHIFHTFDENVWQFVTGQARFNRYTNSPVANYHGQLYNLPFNMNTFYQLWGTCTPSEAEAKIAEQRAEMDGRIPRNLEEQAISLVGRDIYERLIKGYTEKQWGRPCTELPAFIIKRLPVRMIFDNNYFDDPHQGIPTDGYNKLIDALLEGIDTRTRADFFTDRSYFTSLARRIVFTGAIDEYFGYRFGKLAYRTVRFETETLDMPNYQGNAVVNYTAAEVPYTRIIEHKHFEFGHQPHTVISREFSTEWVPGCEPFYPVNDAQNTALYGQYKAFADIEPNTLFGGRLAEYKYYNMDQVVASALATSAKVLAS
jgi:UDP-galactopyranose mutase